MVMNQSNKIVTLGEMNAMASRAGSSPEVMMSPGVDELFSLQLGGPGTQNGYTAPDPVALLSCFSLRPYNK